MSRNARVNFHHGEMLLYASNTYHTLAKSVKEMIQNAIDASATHVFVKIDLRQSFAVVMDNGEGITVEKFDEALASIGRSVKPRQGTLGRFGLGLVSPLGKVKKFTVTSRPRETGVVTEWTFEASRIKPQATGVRIPMAHPSALPVVDTPWKGTVSWATIVKLIGITNDKMTALIDLDELESEILQSFGQAMRIKGTVCRIELVDGHGNTDERTITPRDYSGKPFEVVEIEGSEVGRVEFKLYQAKSQNGARKGVVSIRQDGDVFLLPWKDFLKQARGGGWADASVAFKALGSGFFEGVITAKNIELDPGRTKFVYNDAVFDLYLQIDEWYAKHGHAYMNDETEKARSERLQDLGLRSLKRWDSLLDDPKYAHLREALKGTFVFGRLGSGHVDPASGKPGKEQDLKSVRTGQGGAGQERQSTGEHKGAIRKPDAERDPDRPGDLSLSSIGPRGQNRRLVKHDSLGIQIGHAPLDSIRPWELNTEQGIIWFNTSHRLWERIEQKNAWVLHFQEWVILQVLHLLTMPDERFEEYREVIDRQTSCYVDQFICTTPPKKL